MSTTTYIAPAECCLDVDALTTEADSVNVSLLVSHLAAPYPPVHPFSLPRIHRPVEIKGGIVLKREGVVLVLMSNHSKPHLDPCRPDPRRDTKDDHQSIAAYTF